MTETMANKHWYELNPSRLEMEKMAMSALFPDFALLTFEDGTLRWSGFILSESKQKYNVIVEYLTTNVDINPIVIPVLPDVNGLFCGGMVKFRETMTHEMCGSIGLLNLHSDDSDKSKLETAASKLKKAQVWFENYESKKKKLEEASRDAAARYRQKVRERLKRGDYARLKKSNNYINEVNWDSIIIKNNLIETSTDFIPDESNHDVHWSLSGMNDEFVKDSKKRKLNKITFDRGFEIEVPRVYITPSLIFEYCFKNVIKCWQVVSAYQKISSDLNYSIEDLLDPNLFLESFKKDMACAHIDGKLSKSIIRGTGLKTSFDQDFYINVNDLRFPYCDLEVFIAYTLKHLGLTFLNLSKAYKNYRFIYCQEMLDDVIRSSSYCANIIESVSDTHRVSPINYLPYGVYCYKDIKDNSIHILHYVWDATMIKDNRGYYLRDVAVRCKYKFDDEVSYSDLEFETNDTLITKFIINN